MKIGRSKVDFKGLQIDGPEGRHLIEPKIMGLLKVLVENAGEVMTREELITAVWGVQYGGDESLSRAVSILRKALGDKRGEHKHIITIPRVGYRFVGGVNQDPTVDTLQSLKPNTVETLRNYNNPTMEGETKVERTRLPKRSILSVKTKTMGMAASVLLGCVIVGFLILSGARTSETLSLQAKMEKGFSHIENFTPKGAINEAQGIFSEVLSNDPSHAAARAGLALAIFREYTHLEQDPALLQRAKAHAEAALREDEHLALANIAVAWGAEFEGDFERAHEYLDRADILDSKNIYAFEGRYRCFGKQGQLQKAEEIINTAIAIYPDHALFYTYRGKYFSIKGQLVASEDDFRRAIALSPDNPRTYAELAHSLHFQNRTNEAVDIVQKGLNVNETALLYNNLGTYLFFQGQYALAASAFEKTLEVSGDTHDYLYWANLADAYRWSDDKADEATIAYQRAIQLLQVDLDRYPDDINLKSRAAMFNAKLGNLDKARVYMDSLELTADSPSIHLYRAVVTYEIISDRPKALKHLKAAIDSNYPLIEILNDPELVRLRQDPAYHRLFAETKND